MIVKKQNSDKFDSRIFLAMQFCLHLFSNQPYVLRIFMKAQIKLYDLIIFKQKTLHTNTYVMKFSITFTENMCWGQGSEGESLMNWNMMRMFLERILCTLPHLGVAKHFSCEQWAWYVKLYTPAKFVWILHNLLYAYYELLRRYVCGICLHLLTLMFHLHFLWKRLFGFLWLSSSQKCFWTNCQISPVLMIFLKIRTVVIFLYKHVLDI